MGKSYGSMRVRAAAITAMEEVAQRFGLTVKITNEKEEGAKYGCWFSFELADKEMRETSQRNEFAVDCYARVCRGQVKPEDYGTILISKGLRYKLVGINRDADKYPLQTEALDGGPSYRFPLEKLKVVKGTATEMEKLIYA